MIYKHCQSFLEVVELICFESKLCFGITAYELPSILSLLEKKTIDFQVAKRNNSPKLAQLISHWSLEAAASKSHAGSQQAYIDLICSIVLVRAHATLIGIELDC